MSIVGQPRSRFSTTAPLPSAVAGQIEQAAFSSMVDEAKSRIPDAQTFLKAVMDQDMHTGALEHFTGAVNENVSRYLDEYQKDPFFSFSKQGRNTIKSLQQIVNSPAIRTAVDAKKHNMQQLDQVEKNKMLDAVVIDQGRVRGINMQTGEVDWFRLGEMPEGYQPLNVVEDFQYLDYKEPTRRVNYNYTSLEDIEARIRANLSGTGYDEFKTEYDKVVSVDGQKGMIGVQQGGRSNLKQLEAMKGLTYNMLSEADRNTLYNQYIKSNPSALRDPNFEQNAEKWILDRVAEVAEGRRINSSSIAYGESATAKATGGSGSEKERPIGKAQLVESGSFTGGRPLVVAQQVGQYTSYGTTQKVIPTDLLLTGAKEVMIGGDKNNKKTSMAIEDLPVLDIAFDRNKPFVISLKGDDQEKGQFHQMQSSIGKGTMIDPNRPHGIVRLDVDAMGNPVPLRIVQSVDEKAKRNARPDEYTHEEIRYMNYDPEAGNYFFNSAEFGVFNVASQYRRGPLSSSENPQLEKELTENLGYKPNDQYGDLIRENTGYSMDKNWVASDKGIGYSVFLPYRGVSALNAAMDDVKQYGPGSHTAYQNFSPEMSRRYIGIPSSNNNPQNVHF